jgi:seryl-tRNA synthetase
MNPTQRLRLAVHPLKQRVRESSTQTSSILKLPQFKFQEIVDNKQVVEQNCIARNLPSVAATIPDILKLSRKRLDLINLASPLLLRRSALNTQLSSVKAPERRKKLLSEAAPLKTQINALKAERHEIEVALTALCATLPNSTHPETPKREAETGKIGELKEKEVVKDHVEIAESLDLLDLRAGARTTGHAWYYLKGMGAQLELALVSYAVEMATKRGWTLVKPPDVVRSEVALACGFRPRDEEGEQIYQLANVSVNETGSETEGGSL